MPLAAKNTLKRFDKRAILLYFRGGVGGLASDHLEQQRGWCVYSNAPLSTPERGET